MSGVALLIGLGITAGACDDPAPTQSEPRASTSSVPTASSAPAAAVPPVTVAVDRPVELLQLEESAFGPTLAFDGADVILLTSSAIHRAAPGHPPERIPADLGLHRALAENAVIHWSKASLWTTPLRGGKSKKLVEAPFEPHGIVASKGRVAWFDRDAGGVFTVRTESGKRARSLYVSSGTLVALTLIDGWAFFVERTVGDAWRLGGVSLDGGAPQLGVERRGRAPSMLASHGDLFFYDGPGRSVRRMRPDFTVERTVLDKLVCSPLAVTEARVLCAQVGGVFEIPLESPRLLPISTLALGHVAALAANETHVAWVNDSGENRLTLRVVELPRR